MHLGAEAAADVGCDDPQLMLGNADGLGDPAAVHVRHLALHVDRQGAVGVWLGQDRARLHAGRDQAVVDDAKPDDLIGLARGLPVIAAAHLVDGGDVVGHVVVQLRRAVADRGFLVDHGGQHFVVDVDQADRVVGLGLRFRDHQRHAFADEANAIDRDHRPVRHLGARDDPVRNDRADLAGEIALPDKPRRTPGAALAAERSTLLMIGMGMRRSQHRHMQHARQLDVVDVAALAGEELEILAPPERLADIADRSCIGHGDAPFEPGIQLHGRCCDSRCSGRCCRRGRGGCRARSDSGCP